MTYLRNAWYAAAWRDDIGRSLFSRRLLDEPVLMYRQEDGRAVALRDVCPHRFAPLHLGRLVGDTVQCGYHGLEFDGTGACVHNPHGNGRIPGAARVATYPIEERDGLVWIWMGEPALADASLIPDFSHHGVAGRSMVRGTAHIKSNYELYTDNLMDLSHVQFLHSNFHQTNAFESAVNEIIEKDGAIYSNIMWPNVKASPSYARFMQDPDAPVDRWVDMRWTAPSNMLLSAGVTPTGQPRGQGLNTLGAHILTPETATTTHYFFCHSRDYAVGDPKADDAIREWQRIGFGEQDTPMVEAVQQNMGDRTDLLSMRPILLPSDGAAIRVRRALGRLIDDEQARAQESTRQDNAQVHNVAVAPGA